MFRWRDNHDSGDDSDIIETSDVYRLSDRMRSLKTSSGKKSSTKKNKGGRAKKDDASTQATLSDSDDGDTRRHRSKHEVHERIDSRRSTYDIPGDCCENIHHSQHNKPKSKYYFGTDRPLGDDGGHISANVKTSKFAMENNKVIEDKSFNEDFDRSFKNRDEMTEVRRDYDRFVERTKDHTKVLIGLNCLKIALFVIQIFVLNILGHSKGPSNIANVATNSLVTQRIHSSSRVGRSPQSRSAHSVQIVLRTPDQRPPEDIPK